jgi:hypothetical protein
MAGRRLTGLEFHWFGKGQLLATRYQHGEAMDLEVSAAVADASDDAQVSVDGSESLQRVAARLLLDADGIKPVDAEPDLSSMGRIGADHRISALRCLAANFQSAAIKAEMSRKRDAAVPSLGAGVGP